MLGLQVGWEGPAGSLCPLYCCLNSQIRCNSQSLWDSRLVQLWLVQREIWALHLSLRGSDYYLYKKKTKKTDTDVMIMSSDDCAWIFIRYLEVCFHNTQHTQCFSVYCSVWCCLWGLAKLLKLKDGYPHKLTAEHTSCWVFHHLQKTGLNDINFFPLAVVFFCLVVCFVLHQATQILKRV